MWKQLKSLWGGRLPMDPDLGGHAAGAPELHPGPVAGQAPSTPVEMLRAAQAALGAGDFDGATRLLRPLLLSPPSGGAAYAAAAALMAALGEKVLSSLFQSASESHGSQALTELAVAFLGMDDPELALSLAEAAKQRSKIDDYFVVGLVAEAHARMGRHDRVVHVLERFEGRWPDPALCRRYAIAALVRDEPERLERIEAVLLRDEMAHWLLEGKERLSAFGLDGQRQLRDSYFVVYGGALLDGSAAEPAGTVLGATRLGQIMLLAQAALAAADVAVERVAYAGRRSAVFAHWLAHELDVMVIPLGARIAGQRILVVVADDDEMAEGLIQRHFGSEPALLFQVVKSPRRTTTLAPDLVGIVGHGLKLPLESLDPERLAQRKPARMIYGELRKAAEVDGRTLDTEALTSWVARRQSALAWDAPRATAKRHAYLGDLPRVTGTEVAADPEPAEPPQPEGDDGLAVQSELALDTSTEAPAPQDG